MSLEDLIICPTCGEEMAGECEVCEGLYCETCEGSCCDPDATLVETNLITLLAS